MKKSLTTMAALAMATLTAGATDYTDVLEVRVNGTLLTSQESTITIEQNDGGDFQLRIDNFNIGGMMPIGNIVVDSVKGFEQNGITLFAATQTINITAGDTDSDWIGPALGEIPVEVRGEINDEQLYTIIDINMASLGQTINVKFGDGGYQIGNSDFEDFHTATALYMITGGYVSGDEPDHWHSFMSSTGDYSYYVNGIQHTFISEEVRPGTTGSKSVLVTSGVVDWFNIVTNGTITTGRMNAGSMSATDPGNNAFLDITSTDLDDNGDPFYTLLNGKPDSLSVWVKFKQGTPSEEHPYATLTAVITDGSYYQEPDTIDYSDIIVGRAANTQIASNDYAWQKIVLPFDYDSYSASDPKAILVTISTNADPGEGSGTDSLYVDDFELIYNSTVTGISINGTELEGFNADTNEYEITLDSDDSEITDSCISVTTNSKDAKVFVEVGEATDNERIITVTVYSADFLNGSSYTIKAITETEEEEEEEEDSVIVNNEYTDELTVTVNGVASKQETTVTIEQNEDGTYKLSLNNFILQASGSVMPIGNIVLDNVPGITGDGVITLLAEEDITITEGDASVSSYWMGPMLGEVPINMVAELRTNTIYFIIDINMASLGQIINVRFGDGGYQIGNSDFEDFHTATVAGKEVTSDEPDHWHSFMSCTGTFSAFVNTTPHTFIADEVRPGTTGSRSVLVTSGSVLGVVSNGTITTGRLNAGAISATSTDNNAFLDITSTDLDDNGDPFYTLLNGKPDSLSVWVKFKQGTPSEEHPYATLTAVITDGSYYQEPADIDYSDIIVGSAANTQIETNDYAWQKLVLPFDYDSYSASDPKAILVTISTNADPGEGSGTDSLYVDDFELIYNSTVTGISINGTPIDNFDASTTEYEVSIEDGYDTVTADDIAVTTNAKDAKTFVNIVDSDTENGGSTVTITVFSGDLKNRSTYTVTINEIGETTGISTVKGEKKTVEAIYNLNGQRVLNPVKGQVYITRYTDGTTVKTIEK